MHVLDQRLHDGAEGAADDDADGHVDHVALDGEFLELFSMLIALRFLAAWARPAAQPELAEGVAASAASLGHVRLAAASWTVASRHRSTMSPPGRDGRKSVELAGVLCARAIGEVERP